MNDKIEANQTEENVNAQVKRGRGRPLNPNCTRVLHRDLKTGEIYSQGRIKNGLAVERLTVHRGISSKNFTDETPIISRENIIFQSKKKDKPAQHNINVIVVQPSPEAAPETLAVETGEIIHEDMAVS